MSPLAHFKALLQAPDLPARLRAGLIGESRQIETPFGTRPLLYADYVASGRALRQVEDFVLETVLPTYANTHSEASHTGRATTALREAARAEIARILGAGPDARVIFSGAGATAGLNQIVALLDIPAVLAAGQRAVVLHGPYEHHSNILPWRESGAEVVEIPEAEAGGPDLGALDAALKAATGAGLVVGSFSAMSNVTGIVTDTDAVTRRLKAAGALAIWDYAGGAPYLPMRMGADATAKDAIVFSPHKLPGGPQASGIVCLRPGVLRRQRPSRPGGGTVAFVSPWDHAYLDDPIAREEAGTPGIVGDIRAGLALLVKEALGEDWITARNLALAKTGRARLGALPGVRLLGNPKAPALVPVFSMMVSDGAGGWHDPARLARALSDHHGIQVRGGCSCAGPYGHRLLGIGREESAAIAQRIIADPHAEKPGWLRFNLSYLCDDSKVAAILDGIADIASNAPDRLAALPEAA